MYHILLLLVGSATVIVSIRGETWRKSAVSWHEKVTTTGWMTIVLAFLAFFAGVMEHNESSRELQNTKNSLNNVEENLKTANDTIVNVGLKARAREGIEKLHYFYAACSGKVGERENSWEEAFFIEKQMAILNDILADLPEEFIPMEKWPKSISDFYNGLYDIIEKRVLNTLKAKNPDYGYYPTEIMRFLEISENKHFRKAYEELLARDKEFHKEDRGKKMLGKPRNFPNLSPEGEKWMMLPVSSCPIFEQASDCCTHKMSLSVKKSTQCIDGPLADDLTGHLKEARR